MSALDGDKQKLLERLLKAKGIQRSSVEKIPIAPRDNVQAITFADGRTVSAVAMPASFAQELMWVNAQLNPDSDFYNVPIEVSLRGALDLQILRDALNDVVTRHEVLRTGYRLVDGRLEQLIFPPVPLNLTHHDLSSEPEQGANAELLRLATENLKFAFDLESGPVMRATVVRLKSELHVLLISIHHIAFDSSASQTLISEILGCYRARRETSSPLPSPSLQYADYSVWLRSRLSPVVMKRHLDFWTEQLKGAPRRIELLADHASSEVTSIQSSRLVHSLPATLIRRLERRTAEANGTLFMGMLTGLYVLLHKWSGQRDLVLGTVHANRMTPEVEQLLGNFVNFLALRMHIDPRQTLGEMLTHVIHLVNRTTEHQEAPFDRVVSAMGTQTGDGLYNVTFLMQNFSRGVIEETAGLQIEAQSIAKWTGAAVDFRIAAEVDASGKIDLVVDFSSLYDQETMARFAEQFERVLAALADSPEQRIEDVQLSSVPELQTTRSWGSPSASFESDATLVSLFERRVAMHPASVAIICEGVQLTYEELNERANLLAARLRAKGVRAETLVGLCLNRQIEMVIGIIGILKAGGAYVPLDPRYPAERLQYIAADSAMRIIVTHTSLQSQLAELGGDRVLVDALGTDPADQCGPSALHPKCTAYVIYTSGSTGKPKGVPISHEHVVRLFAATQTSFEFGERDVWTIFHSFAFDFSVWELWGALLHGGRSVIVPRMSTEEFRALLLREHVTILSQTPLAFQQLMKCEASIADRLTSLRTIVFGGEALELRSLKTWFDKYGDSQPRLVNMYGITETTVHVTQRPLSLADVGSSKSWIGRALPDLSLHVLDGTRREVPVGIPGELYVGGAGPARGYLGRPDLTAERFLPNPYSTTPGSRMYKTGDLVRWSTNADLEYLGRTDNQVKIRGYRIELGEVEASISAQPEIAETAVLVREETAGDRRLIGFFTVKPSLLLSSVQLRERLLARLPVHMVPSTLVALDAMPMTDHGKIDRKELGNQKLEKAVTRPAAQPRNVLEEVLVGLFSDVLDRDMGSEDNFLEAGGDSLLAMQLVSYIRDVLQVTISLRTFLNSPCVTDIAATLISTHGEATLFARAEDVLQLANSGA